MNKIEINKLTDFKRGLMRALLSDENCLTILHSLFNEIGLEAWKHEELAKKRRSEQKEVEELILFLTKKE